MEGEHFFVRTAQNSPTLYQNFSFMLASQSVLVFWSCIDGAVIRRDDIQNLVVVVLDEIVEGARLLLSQFSRNLR
jgi:hypothetical protein